MAALEKKDNQYGLLVIKKRASEGQVDVYYTPHEEAITIAKQEDNHRDEYKIKIAEINKNQDSVAITMYPFDSRPYNKNFLNPQYKKIEAITLKDFFHSSLPEDISEVKEVLDAMPSWFKKDYDFGLGLKFENRFVIDAIESLSDCSKVVIGNNLITGIDLDSPKAFNISHEDFKEAVRQLNLISGRSRDASKKVKDITMHNHFASRVGKGELPMKVHRLPDKQLLSNAAQGVTEIDEADSDVILNSLSQNKEQIAKTSPQKLAKLNNDIELVTLKVLVDKFTKMLSRRHNEHEWQVFFDSNPFILTMALGYPIIKIQGQASVGGRKITGSGGKIADFLCKNNLTNNTALIEIKTPDTPLLSTKKAYRGEIFAPHQELGGSINQVLDQKYHFEQEISQIKQNTRTYDIETYAVHCCLVIGRLPTNLDKQKSFELIRGNSKGVQIITYDELKDRLSQLYDLLSNN